MSSRVFGPDDRELLYILADGKCQLCGVEIGADFHADHIIPWARGGQTTIENGQALCADCNLKKGAKMPFPFQPKDYAAIAGRPWQQQGLDILADRVESGLHTHLCVACPGAGKTRLAVAFARALKDAGIIDYVIVVSPKDTIRSNWRKTFDDLANMRVQSIKSNKMRRQQVNSLMTLDGFSTTYQSNARGYGEVANICRQKKTLVILDEIHWARTGTANKQVFGASLEDAFGAATQVLSLSGTPWRSDRCAIPFVRYDQATGMVDSDVEYSYARAIDEKVCRPIIFRRIDGGVEFEHEQYGYVSGELSAETSATRAPDGGYVCDNADLAKSYLRTITNPKIDIGLHLMRKAHKKLMRVRKRHPRAAGLLVAKGVEEADNYAILMRRELGVNPIVVHSSTNGGDSDDIESFSSGDEPWIISVNMITEGTDIPRLRVLVHLHHYMTPMFFQQLCGRIVRWEDDLDGDQTAYVFIPHYGPLHLMAQDIEKDIPQQVDPDEREPSRPCQKCGKKPCVCPCDKCGEKPCKCPPKFFRAIASANEYFSGSTSHGRDHQEKHQDRADALADDPEIGNKYNDDERLLFCAMADDPTFMQRQFSTMSADELRQWAEYIHDVGACNERAKGTH